MGSKYSAGHHNQNPLHALRQAFGELRRVSKTSNGWLMSAPHRKDRDPSFTVFVGRRGGWLVHDFAEGWTMPLEKYLHEHGVNIYTDGLGTPPPPQHELKRPDEALISWVKDNGGPYTGHGFDQINVDSRQYDVYEIRAHHPKNKRLEPGSVAIIVRDELGQPSGIKVRSRFALARGRYSWAESGYQNPLWHSPNVRKATHLIVVEGELKAIATWHGVQQLAKNNQSWANVAVIGIPGKSSYDHVWPYLGRYTSTLFIVDPDIMNALEDKHTWPIQHVWHRAILAGLNVKVVGWHQYGYANRIRGAKDINDFIVAGHAPEKIVGWLANRSKKPRLGKSYVLRHLPAIKLRDPHAGVLMAHYVAAVTSGRWVNGHAIEHTASTATVMNLTKMHPRQIRHSRAHLRQMGLLSKHTTKPVPDGFVLNMTEFRKLLLDQRNAPGMKPNSSYSQTPPPTSSKFFTAELFVTAMFVPSVAYFSPYVGATYRGYISRALHSAGVSIGDIAKMMGTSTRSVYRWMKYVQYVIKRDIEHYWGVLADELHRLRIWVVKRYGRWLKHHPAMTGGYYTKFVGG